MEIGKILYRDSLLNGVEGESFWRGVETKWKCDSHPLSWTVEFVM